MSNLQDGNQKIGVSLLVKILVNNLESLTTAKASIKTEKKS